MTRLLTHARTPRTPQQGCASKLLTHARSGHTPQRCQEGTLGGGYGARVTECDPYPPTPGMATILRHCRCMDCRHFGRCGDEYTCSHDIGGTKVVWATGQHVCDPPPQAWHYCSHYHGPQISTDVWVWRRGQGEKRPAPGGGSPGSGSQRPMSDGVDPTELPGLYPTRPDANSNSYHLGSHQAAQGGPGSNISVEAEQGYDHAPVRRHVADHQGGQGGKDA